VSTTGTLQWDTTNETPAQYTATVLSNDDADSVTVQVESAIPDSALTQDLVAWYRFEDGDARDYTATLDATFADSTAYDGAVNGATFLSSGGVTDFENGGNSGAFSFDGDDWIITPTLSPKTIMCWVKTDSTYTGNDPNRSAIIYPDGSRPVTLWFGDWTSDFSGETVSVGGDLYTPTINAGVWNHWALTDTGGDPAWDLYRNGNKLTRQGTKDTSNSNVTAPFYIGRRDSGIFADADVDDVRFYDKTLTSSEISDIYNATKP